MFILKDNTLQYGNVLFLPRVKENSKYRMEHFVYVYVLCKLWKFDLWQWCDILISTDDIMYGKCWPIYLGFMPCVLLSVWSCVECLWLEKQWSSDLYTLSLIASECTCSTSRWLNWRKCHYLVVTSLSETIFHFLSAFSLFKKVLIFM